MQAKMDMDIDMDVPNSVSVSLIHRVRHQLTATHHPFHLYPEHRQSFRVYHPTLDGYRFKQHQGGSRHGEYRSDDHHYGHYTDTQRQQTQSYHSQNVYGRYYDAGHFGYSTLTPPDQPQEIAGVTVVVDTNVLLDYLVVIQRFVADLEKTKWPSVVIIPSVVISELDWCVDPPGLLVCLMNIYPVRCRQKNTKKSISWSARAASRWILEKLKEDKESKVLRVQASNETLEGSGSNDLVGEFLHDHCILSTPSSAGQKLNGFSVLSSNRIGIQKTISRSGTAVDTSDRTPGIPCFF